MCCEAIAEKRSTGDAGSMEGNNMNVRIARGISPWEMGRFVSELYCLLARNEGFKMMLYSFQTVWIRASYSQNRNAGNGRLIWQVGA